MRVYLAGLISGEADCVEWRKEATHLLGSTFEVDDPCKSRFDKEWAKESGTAEEKIKSIIEKHQAEILLPKSFQSVEKADIVLVNLAVVSGARPIVGTLMEIAWAYQLHKTVIAIKGDNFYSYHPMVIGTVHAWAATVEEAVDIIKHFYSKR